MRILYISNSTSGGGAPASLYNLIDSLNDSHEIAVVLPYSSGRLYELLKERGVMCYADVEYCLDIWPVCINPFKWVSRMCSLLRNRNRVRRYIGRVIDEFRPDIVHTNVGPLAIAFQQAQKRGIPHIWHMREYQDKDFGMTFFPSKRAFFKLIHSSGNYNISITSDIFRHWKLDSDKDAVIYNAVSMHRRAVTPSCFGEEYFLYAARIEKAKDLMTVLRAFRLYRKDYRKAVLLVAGSGRGIYNAVCRLYTVASGLSGAVMFLGYRDDVPSLMSGAKAFIMSSVSEGFGLTTAEAMLNGCLVIGRDTAGTKEQLDRGVELTGREIGLRFTDVPSLASAMSSAMSADYEEMKDAARRIVMEQYSVAKYASQVEAFYQKILSR